MTFSRVWQVAPLAKQSVFGKSRRQRAKHQPLIIEGVGFGIELDCGPMH
jgi:hypothetical protein